MVVRRTYLPWLACALTIAVGVPAFAQGQGERESAVVDGLITVHDDYFQEGADPDDHLVNITPGGRVTFNYQAGAGTGTHDVSFQFSDAPPTTCVQTAPAPIPNVPVPPIGQFPRQGPW